MLYQIKDHRTHFIFWILCCCSCIFKINCDWNISKSDTESMSTAVGAPLHLDTVMKGGESGSTVEWYYGVVETGNKIMKYRQTVPSMSCASLTEVEEPYSSRMNKTCSGTETQLLVKLYIIATTSEDIGNSIFISSSNDFAGPQVDKLEATLNVSYCPPLTPEQSTGLKITAPQNASYRSVASYFCTVDPGRLKIGEIYSEERFYNRTCSDDAKWNGEKEVACHYAPQNAVVNQGSKNAKNSGDFSCNFTDGFPAQATEKFYIGKKEVNKNEILSSEYNSKSLRCEVWNEYSNHTQSPAISGSLPLTVYFAPEKAKVDNEREYIEKNSSKKLRFHFDANPENKVIVVTLALANKTVQNVTNWISPESNTSFIYMINVTINNDDDYGNYIFTASTSMPKGQNTSSVFIHGSSGETTAADTTTDSAAATTASTNGTEVTDPKIALIAGICGGLAFLVIVLLIVYFVIRRNRQKQPEESVREERMNEIYGSAPRHTVDDESSRTREERANVLYVSSGETGGIEEAYAAVDRKGKKKSNGNDNSAYSPEVAEVTYAAVNKPKKNKKTEEPQEAVYSAVNKKKKKKDVDKEPGLHGSPTAGEA